MPLSFSSEIGDPDLPLELIVKDVTDQGLRRPGKVARLYVSGDPKVVAEMLQPKLMWMREAGFVLGGTERVRSASNHEAYFSQSWLCRISSPLNMYTLRVLETRKEGVAVPGQQLRDRVYRGWTGTMSLGFETVPQLGRSAKVARLAGGSISDSLLVDAELEWMTEDRFELSGTKIVSESGGNPETHYANGWLCRYWPPEPEEPQRAKITLHTSDWEG